jgi:hypothetical protein
MSKIAKIFIPLLISASVAGCAVFLPPHPNSNFRENEHVDIEMLTCAQLSNAVTAMDKTLKINSDDTAKNNSTLVDPYKTLFGANCTESGNPRTPPAKEVAFLAPLATAAAGMAIDYVQKQIAEEAILYEAQWGQEIVRDDFLKIGDDYSKTGANNQPYQRYHGFKVCRSVKEIDGCATEIIFGMHPSSDQQLMLIGPLTFKTKAARAKVLSDHWTTFIPPWILATIPGKFGKISGHSIDVDVALDLTAVWRTNNPVKINTESLGVINFKIGGYDLNNQETLIPGKNLPLHPVGWTLVPPPSMDQNNQLISGGPLPKPTENDNYGIAGTFKIKTLITERDTSNAKNLLEQTKGTLESKKPMIIEWVSKQVEPTPTPKTGEQKKDPNTSVGN